MGGAWIDKYLVPRRIVLIYASAGLAWFALSAWALARLASVPLAWLASWMLAGGLYVAVTAAGLSWLARRSLGQIHSAQEALRVAEARYRQQILDSQTWQAQVAEREQAELLLRESEARYRALVEASTDAILLETLDGKVLDCNSAACEMYGCAKTELVGLRVEDLVPEQVARQLPEIIVQQLAQGGIRIEALNRKKNGQVFPVEVSTRVVVVEGERRVIAYVRDITERRQDQERLEMLYEIDRAILSAQSPTAIAQAALAHIRHLIPCQCASVTLFDFELGEARVIAGVTDGLGAPFEGGVLPLDAFPAPDVFGSAPVWHVPDIAALDQRPPSVERLLGWGMRSLISAPLLADRERIGEFSIAAAQPAAFEAEHRDVARQVADQMAIAIQHARLHEQVQRRARELAALNKAGQAIVSTLDLQAVLDLVIAEVRNLLEAEAASVLLHDPAGDELVFAASAGPGAAELVGVRLPITAGIAGWVMREQQPALIRDARTDPRFYNRIDQSTGLTTRSLVAAPLLAKGKITGVIEAINRASGAFTHQDLETLEAMAGSAAVAIENARLFQSEKDQRELAETLREIGAALAATLDRDTVLNRLLEQISRVVPNDAANVMLIEGGHARIARGRGYERFGVEEYIASVRFPLATTFNLRQMLETGKPMAIPDTAAYPGWVRRPEVQWLRSYAGAPIYARGEVIGFLTLDSATPGFFDQACAERLQAFADQAAIALENARLFEETRRRVQELAVISEVALAGAAGRPFDETVERATTALGRLWPEASLGFLFVDETDMMLHLHPSYSGLPPNTTLSLAMDQGITGQAVQEKRPIRVGDVTTYPRYTSLQPGIRSEMAAPLIAGERVIGVVNVESPRLDAFSSDDLRLLTTLAGQLATIFEKARLDAALSRYAEFLERRVDERTAEIRSQQARTQAILDAAGEGVVVTDTSGVILYVNRAQEALTGYSAAQALGRTPRLWQSGQTPPEVYRQMWQTILAGQTWRGEIVNKRQPGASFDASLTIAPIFAAGASRPTGFVGILHDITRLKELDRLKSEFVSNVSHELRTPLSNIKLYLGLLERGKVDKLAQYVAVLKREELRLERLIEDLLTLSRFDLARADLHRVPLDVGALAGQLVSDRQALALDKGLVLTYQPPAEPLPPALADEAMLSQVLTNLIGNAMNYTPRGGQVTVRAGVQAGAEGAPGVALTVQDTGVGISPEEREHLFERFYRGQAARQTAAPGAGLGLAICKEIILRHDGRITVESEPGQGSAFTVWLPALVEKGHGGHSAR